MRESRSFRTMRVVIRSANALLERGADVGDLDRASAPGGHRTAPSGNASTTGHLERAPMVAWLLRSIVLYDVADLPQVQALEFACAVVASARCVELEFPKEGQWVTSLMNPIGLAS